VKLKLQHNHPKKRKNLKKVDIVQNVVGPFPLMQRYALIVRRILRNNCRFGEGKMKNKLLKKSLIQKICY